MIVRSDDSMNFDTAVAALGLAEALDWHYTLLREKELPPAVRAALKEYRRRRARVPAHPREIERVT